MIFMPPTIVMTNIVVLVSNLFPALVDVSYIIRKVFESTFRNWFCLSVCSYYEIQMDNWTLFLS